MTNLVQGKRVIHADFGEGLVVGEPRSGFVRVTFFRDGIERQVPDSAVAEALTWTERVVRNVKGGKERTRRAWLAFEAHSIPIMESAAALTAAKIDLLPHQIVLTHRIATSAPRRFLIADEVGLGKTIETALVLRELASRGEMKRALMIVPAGLVNNWHRELNEVFNLDFEVFGSEGDVTDRRSNAFAKHDRLIASIDTLKRPARLKRILEAPMWDLIVFDEAHHLTAYQTGNETNKTRNYRLAESLKSHTRDMLLLSATPHQGDHYRFWMLMQLLNSTQFKSPADMLENRHRLNALIFRRTKADACRPDGSPLFARRMVRTESFVMEQGERAFYAELRQYLEDGFALAKRQGKKGLSLGFVMTIFQKIAASSFAAVRRTLRRRFLMLTIHEAIIRDQEMDIDRRQRLLDDARRLIREEFGLGSDASGQAETDRILADIKVRLLRKIDDDALTLASDEHATEAVVSAAEEVAEMSVSVALPEERIRIRKLLDTFPSHREIKCDKLLAALGALWNQNSKEKIVIFATYLGTVDLLEREINAVYPGQGVVVLRGGDHGSKLAAERRFKRDDGPRVMVCTAAGREGINLQFSRVLFNFDLPWNPMDLEQRIGRIHRYGQKHTAQVYNLVLSDTIEGKIFLMLDEKLMEIAKTLGKVDENGNVAEDLRSQILGQLSERLSYDNLFQEALSDPELKRTRLELEAALSNASEARKAVFELFQELDGFSLDDYKPFAETKTGMDRLIGFLGSSLGTEGKSLKKTQETIYEIKDAEGVTLQRFTTDRNRANESEMELLGVDHPLLQKQFERWRALPAEELGIVIRGENREQGVLTWWMVQSRSKENKLQAAVVPLGVHEDGRRWVAVERLGDAVFRFDPGDPSLTTDERRRLASEHVEDVLQRELKHKGLITEDGSYSAQMIGWVEVE